MEITTQNRPRIVGKVPLGQVVATRGALDALQGANANATTYLRLHQNGDWGVVCDEDWEENNRAFKEGDRLLSAYLLPGGEKIWVITEADRSVTTLLLPEDY